ncbi:MAG: NmrA family NAD(P)-binding protein [Alphaproteobacteria bacterium]|nr:NmrA family NAD(P)-binding protein [Alphaproteobacteria bacterium]
MILITGASGTVGGAVLTEVSRRGDAHRALYRSRDEAAKAPVGTETVIGDFADPASLSTALRGVESVYLVCAPVRELVELEANMVDACVLAGVRRIVLSSALGAADYPKSFPSWHRQVEEKLRSTSLAHCVLRPNSFMQNVLAFFAPSIRAEGAFYAALADARIAYIDVRDIGPVAADALRGLHDGNTYELHGPDAPTSAELAAKITQHAGIPARFVDIPAAAQGQAMLDRGMPAWQVTALLDLQDYYVGGKGGQPDGTLARLLRRAPYTIDRFLDEFAATFRAA